MEWNRYTGMTPEQLQREQERLQADIEKTMRRLKIAGIVFFIAVGVAAISGTIAVVLALQSIR